MVQSDGGLAETYFAFATETWKTFKRVGSQVSEKKTISCINFNQRINYH